MSAAGQRVTCRPFYSCVPSFPVLYLSILSAVSFEQPSSVFRLPIYKRRPSVTLSYNLYRCYDAYTAAGNHLFFCSGQCTLPMDDFQTGEEASFIAGEVKNIVKESIESTVGSSTYSHNKVQQWTSTVIEQCLNHLTKLGKPFKYVVTCVIMQKSGAGLHTASSCYWDSSTDGSCTVKWENKSMYFIVTVFGLAI
ncbi:unnamed protein product [Dicrocoelium dendriticum]|nr:unnamed protein product [Dicrocoelium dendriticum]